jgi:hypothetical protein
MSPNTNDAKWAGSWVYRARSTCRVPITSTVDALRARRSQALGVGIPQGYPGVLKRRIENAVLLSMINAEKRLNTHR